MESSPLNAVRKDAAQRARDFLVVVLGYLYVESKHRFSNLEVSNVGNGVLTAPWAMTDLNTKIRQIGPQMSPLFVA